MPSNILVIDKHETDILSVCQARNSQGPGILWADDLASGLALMTEARPSLVFLAEDLEGLQDPLGFLEEINRLKLPAQLVIISEQPDFDKAMDWVTSGIFSVLSRPLKLAQIQKIIAKTAELAQTFAHLIETKNSDLALENLLIYKNLAGHLDAGSLLKMLVKTTLTVTGAKTVICNLNNTFSSPLKYTEGHSLTGTEVEVKLTLPWQDHVLGSISIFFGSQEDISSLPKDRLDELGKAASLYLHQAQLFQEAVKLASKDVLTGLFNRRIFMENLDREFNLARRHNSPLSLLMLDLDHFKNVNDTFGHQTGDEILKWLAGVLLRVTRSGDLPARIGGEEFAIILPRTNTEQAIIMAERLKEALAISPLPSGISLIRQTVSQGLASVDHFLVNSPEDLIYWADQAMYLAKREGRDTIRLFSELPSMTKPEDGHYAFQ